MRLWSQKDEWFCAKKYIYLFLRLFTAPFGSKRTAMSNR